MIRTILESDSSCLFNAMKSSSSTNSTKIHTLHVGSKEYTDQDVPDGFFDSLSALKAPDMSSTHSSHSFKSAHYDCY